MTKKWLAPSGHAAAARLYLKVQFAPNQKYLDYFDVSFPILEMSAIEMSAFCWK